MNNLKRVLSLGLTGAMLAGLLTVGASAADFTDVEKIQHSEAVNILVALKIVDGKPDGSFDPEGNVTRAEMAKMIAVAMNGGNEANTGTKLTPSFTDIGGHWAESYIEYCHDLGIISGRGDGTFDPGANVTGLEATKMVLTAMGFDSEAYKLTGASWAVRTDEVARTMTGLLDSEPNMYEDLATVMMANAASRDTAAQLIWNGLQNRTRTVQPTTNKNTGEVEWSYITNATSLLKQRYDANVMTGTYDGNFKTGAADYEGEVAVKYSYTYVDDNGVNRRGNANYSVPSDLGIENIGEEVKVVWKDGNRSLRNNAPDRNDTIFGVFNTGATEVAWGTKNDVGNYYANLGANDYGRIKLGSETYTADKMVDVIYDYKTSSVSSYSTTNCTALDTNRGIVNKNSDLVKDVLKAQSVDKVKLVTDPDTGRVTTAYVVHVYAGQVTGLTSSKITISGVGAIDRASNEIYEDVALDDVVVYNKLYKDASADAYFIVNKAETVEGELEGFKWAENNDDESDKIQNVVVDGTTYKTHNEPETLDELTDDAITAPERDDIGNSVRLYLADGMVVAIQSLESSGGNYAVIKSANIGSGKAGDTLNGWNLEVLLGDGTEGVYAVHKDSTTLVGDDYIKMNNNSAFDSQTKVEALLAPGVLMEFSITGGKIKIKDIAAPTALTTTTGKAWNKTTKALAYIDGEGTQKTAVGAASAVAFVYSAKNDDYYNYTLRNLGDIDAKWTDSEDNDHAVEVAYFMNKDNQIKAAFLNLGGKPGSNTADTLYGIVTGRAGNRKVNGEQYIGYTVAIDQDTTKTIYVDEYLPNNSGDLVQFDEASDECYAREDVIVIASAATGVATDEVYTAATSTAAKKWYVAAADGRISDNVLSYWTKTARADAKSSYKGSDGSSIAVDKDVTMIYVDMDGKKAGPDTGVTKFDTATGFANIIFHTDADNVIDVIFVESVGNKSLAGSVVGFGTKDTVTLGTEPVVTGATVTYSNDTPEPGTEFSVIITLDAADPDNATEFTVTYGTGDAAVTKPVTIAKNATRGTATFEAVSGQTSVTVTAD